LKVGGNCRDNISTHLIQIYNIDTVIFAIFKAEKIHIVALILYYPLAYLLSSKHKEWLSDEHFSNYSVEFIIHFEAIIRPCLNKVFGFGHIPILVALIQYLALNVDIYLRCSHVLYKGYFLLLVEKCSAQVW